MKKLKVLPLPISLILVSLIAIFFQGTVLPLVIPVSVIPDFIIYAVLALAIVRPSVYGVCLAFFCGLIFDLSQGILIGPWAGSYTILFAILVFVSRNVFFSKGLILFFVAALASFFTNSLYLVFTSFVPIPGQLMTSEILEYSLIISLLLKAVITAIFALPFMPYLCFMFSSSGSSYEHNQL